MTQTVDTRGRGVTDLRLSVTDRCNLRCTYCMPRELFGADHCSPRDEILSYEEFARLVTIFAGLGVSKVRLTGGEPLARPRTLITAIAATRGVSDIAMTTNGALLGARAEALSRRRTRSGHGEPRQRRSRDLRSHGGHEDPPVHLLDGIAAAADAGFGPIKLNAVVKRGVNDDGIVDLARYARDGGHILRFIEYMDVGSSNGWASRDVVPAAEMLARVHAVFPVRPLPPSRSGEVARRWAYEDGAGEIGIISSVSEPFCGDCTRARITSTGELFTCLFAAQGRTYAPCCGPMPPMRSSGRRSRASGRHAMTTTPSNARTCSPSRSGAPRCPISGDDTSRGVGRGIAGVLIHGCLG